MLVFHLFPKGAEMACSSHTQSKKQKTDLLLIISKKRVQRSSKESSTILAQGYLSLVPLSMGTSHSFAMV